MQTAVRHERRYAAAGGRARARVLRATEFPAAVIAAVGGGGGVAWRLIWKARAPPPPTPPLARRCAAPGVVASAHASRRAQDRGTSFELTGRELVRERERSFAPAGAAAGGRGAGALPPVATAAGAAGGGGGAEAPFVVAPTVGALTGIGGAVGGVGSAGPTFGGWLWKHSRRADILWKRRYFLLVRCRLFELPAPAATSGWRELPLLNAKVRVRAAPSWSQWNDFLSAQVRPLPEGGVPRGPAQAHVFEIDAVSRTCVRRAPAPPLRPPCMLSLSRSRAPARALTAARPRARHIRPVPHPNAGAHAPFACPQCAAH